MHRTPSEDPNHDTSAKGEPPRSVEDAMALAIEHARLALIEALLAGRAVVDSVSLATMGEAAARRATAASNPGARRSIPDARWALDAMAQSLDEAVDRLRRHTGPGSPISPSLMSALLDALDLEITRWEGRSNDDEEARAVLRAFLGVREVLWELGLRRPASDDGEKERSERSAPRKRRPRRAAPDRRSETTKRRAPRVQRVEVQD